MRRRVGFVSFASWRFDSSDAVKSALCFSCLPQVSAIVSHSLRLCQYYTQLHAYIFIPYRLKVRYTIVNIGYNPLSRFAIF